MTNQLPKFTPEDLQAFQEKGFAGPFQLCTPEEMALFRTRIEAEVLKSIPLAEFTIKDGRDNHLHSPAVCELITHSAIQDCLSQLLGPDLLIWRSSFFVKPPGAPATIWHQTNVFREFVDHPILEPPDKEDLFQLTTWIAIDEATTENGCVQLIPGTHKKSVTGVVERAQEASRDNSFGSKQEGFFGYDIQFDVQPDSSEIVNMECKPGEFFVFTQRLMHGSPPNNSDRRRLGISFRTIQANVKAYGHFLNDGKIEHYGETFNLEPWGCIVLCGQDRGLNKIATPPKGQPVLA